MLFCVVIRYIIWCIMYYVIIFGLNVTQFKILLLYNNLLSCIKAANAIMYNELPMFAYNL